MSQSPRSARRYRKRQNKQAAQQARAEAAQRARRRRRQQRFAVPVVIIAAFLIYLMIQSVSGGSEKKVNAGAGKLPAGCISRKPAAPKKQSFPDAPAMQIDPTKKYTATFETTCGTMVAELAAQDAPVTVNSFVFLARKGFFDGLKFHRVVANFVIQGGDPNGNGGGGPGYTLPEEPPKDNTYPIGGLAMAKTGAPHSTGSQFFVVTGDPAALNSTHTYSLFGRVTKGLDVAKKIESMHPKQATYDGPPVPQAYIFKVSIKESAA